MTDLLTREEINNLGVVLFKPSEAEGEMAKRLKEQAAMYADAYDRAIEDAAQVCENYNDWQPGWGQYDNWSAAQEGAKDCARQIRSLKGNQNG